MNTAISMRNIKLRNFKHTKGLSRETPAFTATIYIDGAKVGTVSNDGGGSACLAHFSDRDLKDAASPVLQVGV